MSTRESRVAYIRDNFSLNYYSDNQEWIAAWKGFCTFTSKDKAYVISKARREWGHFNFEDESEAFAEIFR